MIRVPGNKNHGKRTAELVTLADVLPTLVDLLGLNLPEMKYPIQGESLSGIVTGNRSLNRNYIVSEGWSQACVITKDTKLGIMLDPNPVYPKFDYREFGDMFFDIKNDPLEVDNKINDKGYSKKITKLRSYYQEFVENTPATGKIELILKAKIELNKQ